MIARKQSVLEKLKEISNEKIENLDKKFEEMKQNSSLTTSVIYTSIMGIYFSDMGNAGCDYFSIYTAY